VNCGKDPAMANAEVAMDLLHSIVNYVRHMPTDLLSAP